MTTSPVVSFSEEEDDTEVSLISETDLKKLIAQQHLNGDLGSVVASEQDEFNHLSKENKLDRLNNLIEKSQIYSKIIADNILQSVLSKKDSTNYESNDDVRNSDAQQSSNKSLPVRKRGKPTKRPQRKGKMWYQC